jgi:hypothetical protein
VYTYTYVIALNAYLLATRQLIEIHNRKVPINEFKSGKRQCFVFPCSIGLPIDDCHLLPRLCDTHIISVGKTKQGRDIIAEGGSGPFTSSRGSTVSPLQRESFGRHFRPCCYLSFSTARSYNIRKINLILDTFGKNLFVIVWFSLSKCETRKTKIKLMMIIYTRG